MDNSTEFYAIGMAGKPRGYDLTCHIGNEACTTAVTLVTNIVQPLGGRTIVTGGLAIFAVRHKSTPGSQQGTDLSFAHSTGENAPIGALHGLLLGFSASER